MMMMKFDEILAGCKEAGGCLIWQGKTLHGNPVESVREGGLPTRRYLRRVVAQTLGKWARGRIVMSCGNKACLNPEHMRCSSEFEQERAKGRRKTARGQIKAAEPVVDVDAAADLPERVVVRCAVGGWALGLTAPAPMRSVFDFGGVA